MIIDWIWLQPDLIFWLNDEERGTIVILTISVERLQWEAVMKGRECKQPEARHAASREILCQFSPIFLAENHWFYLYFTNIISGLSNNGVWRKWEGAVRFCILNQCNVIYGSLCSVHNQTEIRSKIAFCFCSIASKIERIIHWVNLSNILVRNPRWVFSNFTEPLL